MRHPILAAILIAITTAFSFSKVQAETFPVIMNQTVKTECGDCHMPFPPQTLPKASWEKIMSNLSNHFGEDASLDAGTTAEILDYHVQNASDVSNVRAAQKWRARGVGIRLTEAPRFIKKHGNCAPEVWTHEKVQSKANCVACHASMNTTGSTDQNIRFLPTNLQRNCGED